MALLFADSFDHYQSAGLNQKYTDRGEFATIVPNGRCNTQCLQSVGQLGSGVIRGVRGNNRTEAIWGFAYRLVSLSTLTHMTGLYGGDNPVMVFRRNATGAIEYSINSQAAFATYTPCTEADVIRVGQWYYIEFKVVVSTSGAGSIEVHVNGENVTLSGFDSVTTGFYANYWDGISLSSSLFGSTNRFDDFYIGDTNGDAPWNDFLGDIRVEYLQPTANGATQDWDNTGGAEAWNSVDDAAEPDEDTSYISTNVAAEEATFEYENSALPSGATVFGVQISFLAKKDEPGDRVIKAIVREGSTNYEGGVDLFPSDDTYDYRTTMMQTNPADSAAWEIDDVNNNEFGVRLDT